jgi:polar amino acid transport system permease protein
MDLARLADVYFNAAVAAKYLPDLLRGAWVTVQLSLVIIVTGAALGLGLALLRLAAAAWLGWLIRLWVDCLRALPPLALILLLYFGLPNIGLALPTFSVLWLTLSCVLAAFAEEIFWAGLVATGRGQWEAARSTGLAQGQTLRYVILPQAMRLCIPPLTNRAIAITKNTALGTTIGMPELLNEAMTAQSFSGNATPLILACAGYLLIFLPLIWLAGRLERGMRWGARP